MTHSAKKPKVDSEDCFSALPDVLLHQILSFMELREAMAMSVLSKRWRYLWRFVPNLNFGSWNVDKYPRIPTIVSDCLSMFDDRAEIKKFRIELFDYVDADRIDSWIRFVVKHKVKELCLNIFTVDHTTDNDSSRYCYNLHRFLADCETLEVLRSGSCMLNLTSSISFRMLKVLDLFYVWLPNLDTSGCPVLESIVIRECNNWGELNINAPNPRLRSVKIVDTMEWFDTIISSLILYAPYVRSVEVSGFVRRNRYIMKLQSLRSSTLDFHVTTINGAALTVSRSHSLLQLLNNVSHAPTLELSVWCIEVLHYWEAKGDRLPTIRAKCLTLEIKYGISDIQGMASVLKSSPFLECLTLHTSVTTFSEENAHFLTDSGFDQAWGELENSLAAIQHLTAIRINGFLQHEAYCSFCLIPSPFSWDEGQNTEYHPCLCGEPVHGPGIDKFLDHWKNEIKLVKLLLNNCKKLEKMIITTGKMHDSRLKSKLLHCLAKKLEIFPRASEKAEISVLEFNQRGNTCICKQAR